MRRAPASVWVLLGAGLLAFGSSPILIRLADDAPAFALAAWRTTFVTGLLAPLALTRYRAEIGAFSRRDVGLVVVAGVLLGLHFMAWIASVQLTSVAAASVLVTTNPIMIAVLGAVFLKETPARRTQVAIAVAVVGATLIGLGEREGGTYPDPALGNALALGAAFLVSVYLLIGRAVRQQTSFVAYFAPLNAVAALTCVAGCLLLNVPMGLDLPVLGLAFLMGVGPGLFGHGSFTVALRYLPAAFLGLLGLAEPVIASAIAFGWFGETPSALALGGAVVILVAIAAVVTSEREA
ncbi:MAG: DMT family transporter [Bacteroidota bacterium]